MTILDNLFKTIENEIHPHNGSLLISEPLLQDHYFERAVILLVEHDVHGSLGFVLNKRTKIVLNDFHPFIPKDENIHLYLGGPVDQSKLFFIHDLGEEVIPGCYAIGNGLYFDGDFNAMKRYIEEGGKVNGHIKFIMGYSGWNSGQLATELNEHAWIVSEPHNLPVLKADGEGFWKDAVINLGERFKHWVNYPKKPFMN